MFGPPLANTTGRPPDWPIRTRVRVTLRDGRQMIGFLENFTFNLTLGDNTIMAYERDLNEDIEEPRPLKKAKKLVATPSMFETMSRCLPDDFLWGDPFTPEVAEHILKQYERTW